MFYINQDCIENAGINWNETINVIEQAVSCILINDFAQPVKPYLRYGDIKNRIIAMPAYVGGDINMAGIKWIASFPDNIKHDIPRAHSVVVLNDAGTGEPISIINSALLSIIRTASVSGLIIKQLRKSRAISPVKIGITGFGPIGQYHALMCNEILKDVISDILVFDLREINPSILPKNAQIVNSWQDAYADADIFITCTVSKSPYINLKPKKGSLHLNVSLRDYLTNVYDYFKGAIFVDDWKEICRENTDIENMYKEKRLKEEDTGNIVDIVCNNAFNNFSDDVALMFNPMGMAIFDIALGGYYLNISKQRGVAKLLMD